MLKQRWQFKKFAGRLFLKLIIDDRGMFYKKAVLPRAGSLKFSR